MSSRKGDSSRRPQPRLPVIAPRHEAGSSSSESGAGAVVNTSLVLTPRTRLPPRSRSGCWTCRQRKVKCDEQRPTCGQCARLNHTCDYNPRLAFRDDTPRVKERMSEIRSEGNAVWDPQAPQPDFEIDTSSEDVLPEFSTLTTDEERERKALSSSPGTYLVVANPDSFSTLPEYSDCAFESPTTTFPGIENPFDPAGVRIESVSSATETEDPNIIILKTFEDAARKASISNSSVAANQTSPTLSFRSQPQSIQDHRNSISGVSTSYVDYHPSLIDQARSGGRDSHLLYHYRTYISPIVIKVGDRSVDEDIFEIEAQTYSPLFHAMMAISALSLAHRTGVAITEAMVHYGQVIIALREVSDQSSVSDGAMFTHYLLLLYEIAHAGLKESAMWTHHCDALLRIITERRKLDHQIPHPFIVWMICLIDTYALLSGEGNGSFVQLLMDQDLFPASSHTLPPLNPGLPQIFLPEEINYFPSVIELNHKVVFLAIQVGETARDLRAEEERRLSAGPNVLGPEHIYVMNRLGRVRAVQDLCRTSSALWSTQFPDLWPIISKSQAYPPRVLGFLHHAHNLYRACVIYAHTSMYPNQMTEPAPEYALEVPHCITEILTTSVESINTREWGLSCLTFSLFLAGFAATDAVQKNMAVQLMRTLEPHSFGENTSTLRGILEQICMKQQRGLNNMIGYDFTIDWVIEVGMTGRGLIMFGQ